MRRDDRQNWPKKVGPIPMDRPHMLVVRSAVGSASLDRFDQGADIAGDYRSARVLAVADGGEVVVYFDAVAALTA
jgi:hypothetical protein